MGPLIGLDAEFRACHRLFGGCMGAKYDLSVREVQQSVGINVNAELEGHSSATSHIGEEGSVQEKRKMLT